MATRPADSARRIYPARGDALRIVPLHLPEALKTRPADAPVVATSAPQLSYRNGPLLASVEVYTVFWGAAWAGAEAALAAKLNQFFDFVLTSPLLDQLGEYSVPGFKIGHGRRTGSVTLATPVPGASVSDSGVQHLLQHEISGGSVLPPPSPNTLYFVYLPPGVRVVQGGSASCTGFCGYHSDISGQVFYAVMPYPGCAGCTGGLALFDALTSTSSHELCEAITDPIPGQGWYDDNNGEIGDICAWKTRTLGTFTIQLEWSNQSGSCV